MSEYGSRWNLGVRGVVSNQMPRDSARRHHGERCLVLVAHDLGGLAGVWLSTLLRPHRLVLVLRHVPDPSLPRVPGVTWRWWLPWPLRYREGHMGMKASLASSRDPVPVGAALPGVLARPPMGPSAHPAERAWPGMARMLADPAPRPASQKVGEPVTLPPPHRPPWPARGRNRRGYYADRAPQA